MTDEIVKAAELARRWKVSARQIGVLTEKGIIARGSRGILAWESTARYLEHLRKGASGRATTSDERRRVLTAQAEKLEYENAVARDKYFLKTEALHHFTSSLVRLRGYLMAVPDRVAQRLGHLTRRDVDEIKKEVAAALYDDAREELIFIDYTPEEAAEILGPHPEGEKK